MSIQASHSREPQPGAAELVDVAIVGGGISGLYSAWRLKEKHPQWRIVIYERDDRTGGRLLSARPPGMPNVRAELGGMRYLSTHRIVDGLARHLGMEILDFPVSERRNLAYLRGHQLRREELTDPKKVPYRLAPEEQGKTIGQLMLAAMERIVPGISRVGRRQQMEMAKRAVFLGRPLYQWGFWNALYRAMSPEAYSFVVDASGYDTTVSNWNAADAIPWFLADFGPNAIYRYPREGMQGLPDRVRDQFLLQLGGEIVSEHTLARASRAGGGKLRLEFKRKNPADPPLLVDAAQVILAMPRRSLELIDLQGAFGDRMGAIRTMIESVAPQPLFKLFACYDKPWWRGLGVRQGQTTTDTPLRQTYYFQTEGEQPGADPRNTSSLLMASYNDGRSMKYWIGLLREMRAAAAESSDASGDPDAAAEPGDEQWQRHLAHPAMLEEIRHLLVKVHGMEVPRPYSAAYYDWSGDPYGGGYNLWKIHAKSWEVSSSIVQPVAELPLYICGEAYSTDQGWVEGALETAEDVLKRGFGLPPPEWLRAEELEPSGQLTEDSATLRM